MSTRRYYPLHGTAATPRESAGRRPRHVINPQQKALYWREWAACKDVLRRGGMSPAEAEEHRHVLHGNALGEDKSSKDFSDRDLDLVLGAFRAVSRPDDLGAQLKAQDGPRRRLLEGIRRLAQGNEAYIDEVMVDIYPSRDWRRLDDTELMKLRATLARRIGEKSKAGKAAAKLAREAKTAPRTQGLCDICGEVAPVREQTGHGDRAQDQTGFFMCEGCLGVPAEEQEVEAPF